VFMPVGARRPAAPLRVAVTLAHPRGTYPPALRAVVRQATRHRRLLAAGLVAGAVACALSVLAPSPPPSVSVLVAARALDAGVQLSADDLHVAQRPAGTSPGALTATGPAVGRVLAAPVGAGEALTAERLVGPGLAASLTAHGHVAAPVRLADPEVAGLLRPGDVVDVVLAGSATAGSAPTASVVAGNARVVTVVASPGDSVLGTSSGSGGALVVLDVPRDQALSLARAAALGPLSVLLEG
jgi:pilus assembly protein CpaB